MHSNLNPRYQIVSDVVTALSYSPVSSKEASAAVADTATTANECTSNAATARTISITGDATGSASFDGSANVSISMDVTNADSAAACTGNAATATTATACSGNSATATQLATDLGPTQKK